MNRMNMVTLKATADAAGDGTDSTDSSVHGNIKAVYVKYDASSAAGTDVTLKDAFGQTIVNLANANTSVVIYPRTPAQDNTGTDVTFDGTNEIYTEFSFYSKLTLTIADQTAAKAVTAYILYESA